MLKIEQDINVFNEDKERKMEQGEISNVSISILVSDNSNQDTNMTTIEIYDEDANIKFLEIKLTNDQFVSALSRLAHTPVQKCIVKDLEHVGKKRLLKDLVFEVDRELLSFNLKERNVHLSELAQEAADPGWTSINYFSSQRSISIIGDKKIVRTSQYKYVAKYITDEEKIAKDNI